MKTKLTLFLLALSLGTVMSQTTDRIAKTPKVNHDWQTGFVSITELTGAFGLGITDNELSKYYYGITTLAGYQFSRNIKIGAGTGVHVHNEGVLLPVFLDFRLNYSSQEIVPFLAGSGGILVDVADVEATRLFINPSIGIRYIAASRKAVTFSTGLMVTAGGINNRKSFINFKLGLELKGK